MTVIKFLSKQTYLYSQYLQDILKISNIISVTIIDVQKHILRLLVYTCIIVILRIKVNRLIQMSQNVLLSMRIKLKE